MIKLPKPTDSQPSFLRHPIEILISAGILTCYPSITLFSLTLGPTYPAPISGEQETLDFRRIGFSPILSLLMSAFSLLIPPTYFTIHLLRPTERSPTNIPLDMFRSFGV